MALLEVDSYCNQLVKALPEVTVIVIAISEF